MSSMFERKKNKREIFENRKELSLCARAHTSNFISSSMKNPSPFTRGMRESRSKEETYGEQTSVNIRSTYSSRLQ